MQEQVSERVRALRDEIVKIRLEESLYRKSRKTATTAYEHEKRIQRLREIMEELGNLTDWKKQP